MSDDKIFCLIFLGPVPFGVAISYLVDINGPYSWLWDIGGFLMLWPLILIIVALVFGLGNLPK